MWLIAGIDGANLTIESASKAGLIVTRIQISQQQIGIIAVWLNQYCYEFRL
jgi:hypothetical protein